MAASPPSIRADAGVVSVDQTSIRGSRRSSPATYTGLLDPVRKALARANGVKPGPFSANSAGACPNGNGASVVYTDLAMMAGVATTCEACEGRRFQPEVLEYHRAGRDISEVLAMPVTEALAFSAAGEARTKAAHPILERMEQVGLGYLSRGRPDRLRGHSRRPRRSPFHAHRRAPRGLRRQLTGARTR